MTGKVRKRASIPGDPRRLRTLATTNKVVIAGETRGPDSVTHDEIESVVRAAIKDIGYEQDGFHWEKADIDILLHPQSADIAPGRRCAAAGHEQGRGRGATRASCSATPATKRRTDAGPHLLRPTRSCG